MMALCTEMIITRIHQKLIMDWQTLEKRWCRLLMHWQILEFIIRRLLNKPKTPYHWIEFQWWGAFVFLHLSLNIDLHFYFILRKRFFSFIFYHITAKKDVTNNMNHFSSQWNKKNRSTQSLLWKRLGRVVVLTGYKKQIKKETYLFCDKSLFVSFFKRWKSLRAIYLF